MAELVLGRLKFNWKGNWAATTAYIKDDVVKYGPSAWVCTANHTSTSEFDFTKFQLMTEGVSWAGEWNNATSYQVNDIVNYGGAIYVCVLDHQPGDSTDTSPNSLDFWQRLVGGLEWEDAYSNLETYQKGDIVKYGGYTYINKQTSTAIVPTNTLYWDILNKGYTYTGGWSSVRQYYPGELVSNGGKLYAAITTNINSAPPTANWENFASGSEFTGEFNIANSYYAGQIVRYGGNQYICTANTTGNRPTNVSFWTLYSEGFNFRGDYTSSTTYNPGDVVKYGGRSYICILDAIYTSPTQILPTDAVYWNILNKGLDWKGNWSDLNVTYKLDDVVEYSGSSYVCISPHTSTVSPTPNVDTLRWQSLAQGDSTLPMTTTGDMIYRNASGAVTRLPIGASGAFLVVNNGIPSWGTQAPERNYYVSLQGSDSNDGRTVATAWRTLQHACQQTFNGGQAKISVMAGTYTELCPIKVGKEVVIEGDGLGAVTIRPENSVDKGFGVGISKDGSTPNANSEVFHVNNASRIRNLVFRGFGSGAVCVSLDPGYGPNDTSVWITSQSPYIQNCTSFTDLGTGMVIDGALHNGGYKSIVANDWTQINSDGFGFIVKNDGRSELVSCFTYYCHIGYLCESGGKIRSVGGNNSYGEYGAVARGFSQAETPLTGNLQLSDDTINSIQLLSNDLHVFTSYKDIVGNLLVVGHTTPSTSDQSSTWQQLTSKPVIAKITADGNLDWFYTYDSKPGALHCIVEIDSGYYAGGVIYDGGTNKGFLIKVSGSGEIQWQKTVGDTTEVVDVTTNGSNLFVLANHTTRGAVVTRVTSSGLFQWSTTLDYNDSTVNTLTPKSICFAGDPTTSTDSYASAGDVTAEYNLYVALRDSSSSSSMVARLSQNGSLITAYNYGNIHINRLRLDTGNGDGIYLMAAGYYDPAGASTKTPFAMRLTVTGQVAWQNTLTDSTFNGEFLDVIPQGDGVYAVGYMNDTDSTQTFNRGLIVRYTSAGSVSWIRTITDNAQNIWLTGVTIDGVNVISSGNRLKTGVIFNIQRDLASGIGTVTQNNWALSASGIVTSAPTVTNRTIQNIYGQNLSVSLTDTTLTLNQSPGLTRAIQASRTGFAGIGRGVTFTISGLSRSVKPGSVLQITGDTETYFVISVANFDGTSGTCSIGIDPAIPSNKTPNDNTAVAFREAFSQVRMTSHDFLDIGTGGFADTNYPVIIQADYAQQPDPDREIEEEQGGRCFYVTTDQDGNFRVGNYFKVEQSTGRATLSSEEFDLSGLNELQLGSITAGRQGATVNEFSTDGTMGDNSDTAVPTERAVVTYVTSRLDSFRGALRNWSIKTSNYTATTGDQIFVDTSAGAVTITLPSAPVTGDIVRFCDLAGTFDTNNLIVAPNGEKILGAIDTMVVNTENAAFALVYSNATYGWKLLEI